jgi:hypothetical protein
MPSRRSYSVPVKVALIFMVAIVWWASVVTVARAFGATLVEAELVAAVAGPAGCGFVGYLIGTL